MGLKLLQASILDRVSCTLLCGLLSARGWGTREVFVDGVDPVRLLGLVVSESPQTSEKPSPTHPQGFLRCAETGAGNREGGRGGHRKNGLGWLSRRSEHGPVRASADSEVLKAGAEGGVCHLGRGHLCRVCSPVFVLAQQVSFL